MNRDVLARLFGVALLMYGAVGLATTLYGHSLVRDGFASARELGLVASIERSRAERALAGITTTLQDATVASANLTSSFEQSHESLNSASRLSANVAVSLRQAAAATSLELFGTLPMGGLTQPLLESSDDLDALSQDLARTSEAVGTNAGDMQRLANNFARLKGEVDGLSGSVARLPEDPASSLGTQRLEMALNAMLAWIGLQAMAAIFAGLAILLLPLARRHWSNEIVTFNGTGDA